jgi:uncharacterized protein (TIGR03435 family)
MRLPLQSPCSVHRVVLFVLLWSFFRLVVAQAPQPAFEVASVRVAPADADPQTGFWSRPGIGRFTASHVSLARLIQLAYGIDDSQIANKPGWMDTNLYDVDAKPEEGVSLTREELKPCLQELLHERFHLVAHMETRSGRGYALVVAQDGPHLKPASAGHFARERHPVSTCTPRSGLPGLLSGSAAFRERTRDVSSGSRMREICMSGSTSGVWKRSTVRIMRHRLTKGPETDRPDLTHRATSRLYRKSGYCPDWL